MTYDYAIIGGGIVGLATAMTLLQAPPDARVVVIEKEDDVARHQTGRNSGVIHSGIYYPPASLKARMARDGNLSMREFCEEHGLAHEICGKLIVATAERELPLLDNLLERGQRNGLNVEKLTPEQAREIEPHVSCLAALRVSNTGIVSYRAVARKYAELIQESGGELQFATRVLRIQPRGGEQMIETDGGEITAGFIINCAGLHSDRVAALGGCEPGARIIPFRGEYYELIPEKRALVKGLIYPVPNPAFPFLGVHFTRMIGGSVHAGPNAVLAFQREGYRRRDVTWQDLRETLFFPGFRKLAVKHWDEGWREMVRSFSKRAFVRSLQKLVPEITERDLIPCASGVRAQALRADGSLVEDFLIVRGKNSLHVCNAPSPAATASLEIARELVKQIPAFEMTAVAVA
ncbi:MAG TPA: L-2-hydroxyglutarate oxidase [Candidatus Limnocylindria bacterium]|nr:L-2-hydroxyglutarate oxidase [Candidatus Limnocylindria bacterium]